MLGGSIVKSSAFRIGTVEGPIASNSGCKVIEDMPAGIVRSPVKIPSDCGVNGMITPDKSTAGEKSPESGLKSSEPWKRTLPSIEIVFPGSTGKGYIDENWLDSVFPR